MSSMFNNFSRFIDSGRRRRPDRERTERRRYEPEYDYDRRSRQYEDDFEPDRYPYEADYGRRSFEREPDYDYEQEREEAAATIRELGRERTDLKAQVAELKQQVELLNSLMETKDNQVKELREAMENNNTEQINKLISQIEQRFDKLEHRLDAGVDTTLDTSDIEYRLSNTIESKMAGITGKMDEIARSGSGSNDEIVNVISENVHNESVKCYRNIQVILEEIQKKLDAIENKKVSLLGTTACVVITMLLSLGNLALIVLRILEII